MNAPLVIRNNQLLNVLLNSLPDYNSLLSYICGGGGGKFVLEALPHF